MQRYVKVLSSLENVICCSVFYDFNKQGGIDESENPRDAAIRELREETGVTSAEIIAEV